MILSCHHISKAFVENTVLSDVTFHLEKGEKAAIVGMNGPEPEPGFPEHHLRRASVRQAVSAGHGKADRRGRKAHEQPAGRGTGQPDD